MNDGRMTAGVLGLGLNEEGLVKSKILSSCSGVPWSWLGRVCVCYIICSVRALRMDKECAHRLSELLSLSLYVHRGTQDADNKKRRASPAVCPHSRDRQNSSRFWHSTAALGD
jgi:hypothetical protein